jgi:hypothetical protein
MIIRMLEDKKEKEKAKKTNRPFYHLDMGGVLKVFLFLILDAYTITIVRVWKCYESYI